MATFEEKWNEFKNYLKENVPDWNTQFLNWADARGFGFGGGFFNEFPHTHTYETDLSWLISRMKWTLWRMDSVEARMKAVEELLVDFIESMDINQLIRDGIVQRLQELIDDGTFADILDQLVNPIREDLEEYKSLVDSKISGLTALLKPEIWYTTNKDYNTDLHFDVFYAVFTGGIFIFQYRFDLLNTGTTSTAINNLDFDPYPGSSEETLKQFVRRKMQEAQNVLGYTTQDLKPQASATNIMNPRYAWYKGKSADEMSYGFRLIMLQSGSNGPTGSYKLEQQAVSNAEGTSYIPICSIW